MKTTIQVKKTTKERLSKLGCVNSTYDSLINEILDHLDKCDRFWEDIN